MHAQYRRLTESANSIPDLCFFACSMMQSYCSLFSVSQILKHDVASLCVFFKIDHYKSFLIQYWQEEGQSIQDSEENKKRI